MQNHKKQKSEWNDIAKRANAILSNDEMTTQGLITIAGIDYHTARRMLLNGIRSQTAAATIVCKKLGLIPETVKVQTLTLADVQKTLEEHWSGESGQAELLIRLIRSTADLNINYKSEMNPPV
jgi:hypothetical protein